MATSGLLLLLLISFIPFSAFADVTWSIDCGTSSTYYDNNDIQWQGDETLITTGQSRTVKTNNNSFHDSSSTLRVFNSGKKNCYALKGEKGAKLLVRASFFHGNYDGKSSPPRFGLELDGNDWDKVGTFMEDFTFSEVTYVSKGDLISVCLVQTDPDHFPFISALEVRTLGSKMYQYVDSDKALNLFGRHSYGSDNVIRYPQDAYDRLWVPLRLTGSDMALAMGEAFLINTLTVPENPPKDAIVNAATISSSSSVRTIKWALTQLDSIVSPVYINLYFTEVRSDIDPRTEKRSFNAYLESGTTVLDSTTTAITPQYGGVTEVTSYTASASNATTIRLEATSDSTLPPIINAIEVFKIIDYSVYEPATATSGGSSGGATPPSSSTDTPTSSNETDESTSFDTAPSSGKKKSRLPVILGAGIPGFLLLVAFVAVLVGMQQKRQRAAAMAAVAAKPGGNDGNGGAYNNNYNGQIMMGANVVGQQMTMNYQFNNVNLEEGTTRPEDPNSQLQQYGSPAPLLNQTH